ncbi:MAG: FUSC family protein [Pseudolabrys sp.]
MTVALLIEAKTNWLGNDRELTRMTRAPMTWLISVQRDIIGAVQRDIIGVRFAVNVFIGTTVTWYVLTHILDDENPIWAIASMVAASDPQVKEAVRIFKSRLINVLLGCAVGLIFVVMGGSSEWKLPLALAVTVLLSSYLVQIPTMWRQAPITAAIVIAAGLTHHSKLSGIEHGVHKVAEVIFGCLVGLLVSLLMAKIWPVAEPENRP